MYTVYALNKDSMPVVTSAGAVGRDFVSCDSMETRSVCIDGNCFSFATVKCHFVRMSRVAAD